MLLEIKIPDYPLRKYVKLMIYYQGYSADSDYEKLLPDGNSQLIIELDGERRYAKNGDHHSEDYFRSAWITGVQTKPVTYLSERNATTLCMQFEIGGLYALLGVPAIEFSDRMVDASLPMGNSISLLREQLLECTQASEVFDTASGFLLKRMVDRPFEQNMLAFITKKTCLENLNHSEMSDKSGYSKKHLIQVFKKHVGLSPKKFQRIHRFNKTLDLLNSQKTADFADIAAQCQFFDQAHFSREFSYFAGLTPGKYLQSSLVYPHVIPINSAR